METPAATTAPTEPATVQPEVVETETSDAWKLFVGQIPRNIRQEDLLQQFMVFGEIEEVFVIRDQSTGLSKGCCFVRFRTKESAERCIEAFNDKVTLPGASNPLQVSFAANHANGMNRNAANDAETKLFVGQMPPSFLEVDIQNLFQPYGIVKEIYIMRNRDTGAPKGACFVRLEADQNQVRRAIGELTGRQLEGAPGPLKVDVAHQKQANGGGGGGGGNLSPRAAMQNMMSLNGAGMRGYPMQTPVMAYPQPGGGWYAAAAPPNMSPMGADRSKAPSNFPKLFVGGLTPHTTEADLHQLFSHYGQVREVVILRYPNGHSKSSGFVKYATEQEADVAVASLSNRYCLPESSRPLSVRYAGPANNPPEHKLFVGHLPAEYDEARTEQLFRSFGDVVEVHVMRDTRGMLKGSAFVKFADRSQAETAIQMLNGSTGLSEKPLKVAFAISRGGAMPGGVVPQQGAGVNPHHMMQPQMMQQQGRGGMLSPSAGGIPSPQQQTAVAGAPEHLQQFNYYYPTHMAPTYFAVSAGTQDGTSQMTY